MRKIEDLEPEMQLKAIEFKNRMDSANLSFIFTSTRRTQEEQDALYAQGRTAPGKIVTWTRQSKHIDGLAFDIAMVKGGEISWNPSDYKETGEIGESIGLTWGGKWAKPDYPHFQLDEVNV